MVPLLIRQLRAEVQAVVSNPAPVIGRSAMANHPPLSAPHLALSNTTAPLVSPVASSPLPVQRVIASAEEHGGGHEGGGAADIDTDRLTDAVIKVMREEARIGRQRNMGH